MKRVKAACICQTLHFILKEELDHETAAKQVRQEAENYKAALDRNHTKYKIVEEYMLDDDSIIIKVIKQYNQSPVGNYLD